LCHSRGPSNFHRARSVFLHPLRGEGSRTSLHQRWRIGWPSSVLLAESNARFETNVSRLTCVSKSATTQKLERQRVDGNEQRLHRSVGLLILAKSTRSRFIPDRQQHRISRSPWSGSRGRRNSIADLSEVRYTEVRHRSVPPRRTLGQLYPTRPLAIWSQVLSLKDAVTANSTLAPLEIEDISRRGT
jgi:hypothetical protein